MMIYLQNHIGFITSSLADALTRHKHFEVDQVNWDDREGLYDLSTGLARHRDLLPEEYTRYWHGVRTDGYMAYMAFDPDGYVPKNIVNCIYQNRITCFVNFKFITKCKPTDLPKKLLLG